MFKIFVANPRKDAVVLELLVRNKERMIMFLSEFLHDRAVKDDDFREERSFLINEISEL